MTTYRDWLERSEVQKVLFCAQPGALVPAGVVDWCRQNLKNLKAIDVGRGVHYLQEDNPHFIGGELVRW